jgi:Flp pilus assembly protein TadG
MTRNESFSSAAFTRAQIRRLAPGAKRESGQSVVEFALVVPLICVIVLILVDFGKAMSYWLDVTQVANEGARLAAVNGPVTPDVIRARLKTTELRTGGGDSIASPADVAICYGAGQVGDPVTVTVSTGYHWVSFPSWVPIAGGGIMNIRGKATMRLEQQPTYAQAGSC